jgi:hypothetical protein
MTTLLASAKSRTPLKFVSAWPQHGHAFFGAS